MLSEAVRMHLRRELSGGSLTTEEHYMSGISASPPPPPPPPPPPQMALDPIRHRLSSVGDCGDSSGASGLGSGVGSAVSGSCSAASSGASSGASSAGSDDYMSAAQLQACRRNLDDSSSSPDVDAASPVTDEECQQAERSFSSLKAQVFVCPSLCNLYTASTSEPDNWQLRFTGIPVVILNTGETVARNKRCIQLFLSERGSCFTLWHDTIDNLSSYQVVSPSFHTMCLSSDHSALIGLSFDCADAAAALWQHVERLTACPENISLSGPRARRPKRPLPKKSQPPSPAPSKAHISLPCCFQHVTSVDCHDRSRYFSLQTLVPALMEVQETLTEREV